MRRFIPAALAAAVLLALPAAAQARSWWVVCWTVAPGERVVSYHFRATGDQISAPPVYQQFADASGFDYSEVSCQWTEDQGDGVALSTMRSMSEGLLRQYEASTGAYRIAVEDMYL